MLNYRDQPPLVYQVLGLKAFIDPGPPEMRQVIFLVAPALYTLSFWLLLFLFHFLKITI